MNKKIIFGILFGVVILASGIFTYIQLNNGRKKAPETVKEPEEQVQVGDGTTENQTGNGKTLIVYFSVPETTDANKKMNQEEENSTIVVDGKVLGNTQYIAQLIQEYQGGDIYRIEPKTPYTTNHKALVDFAQEEQKNNARPEIKTKITNFDDYDTIYIGYPIWWGDMPQILYTFLELYHFEGKTVIPFSTHGGSGLSGTVETLNSKLKGAHVETNAFTLSRTNMEEAKERVKTWLNEIS